MQNYFQVGSVAAYHHIIMIKLDYRIVNTLNECLAILEERQGNKLQQARKMNSKQENVDENERTQKVTDIIVDMEMKERKKLEEDLNDYELWPVISAGIVYQF